MTHLAGQVALITGASQGIGQAIAESLAAQGVHLMLAARSVDKLSALSTKLKTQYPALTIETGACDVQQASQVQTTVEKTLATFKRIDILVNNAGVAPKIGLLQEMSIDDIDRTIDTNLKGAMYAMHAVLPVMVRQQSGVIVNINSVAGKTAYPFWAIYDASKFGLYAVTEAVAEEQRSNGIKVMGVYPGAVDTAIWDGLDMAQAPDKKGMMSPQDIAEAVLYALKQPQHVFTGDITLTPLKPAL